jgi:hypothetical protein
MEPAEIEQRSWLGSWILLAAIGVVIFLVGVTLGVLSRGSSTVRVTTTATVTAYAAPAPSVGGAAPAVGGSFGDGLYRVGIDIAAGNYRTNGGPNCYWERLNNLSGGFTAIISNGEPTGPTTVRVNSSDKAFSVHGGCTWTVVP